MSARLLTPERYLRPRRNTERSGTSAQPFNKAGLAGKGFDMDTTTEKTVGTSLTPISEYATTALVLADLQKRHKGVVYDVTAPKQMKLAKEARAEIRNYRTSLEKTRVEIKAPALERCRLIDSEAKRITAELVALEEPIDVQIKAEEARAEAEKLARLEAERLRVEAIQRKIDAIRNVPAGLIGKPSAIIAGQLAKLEAEVLDEDEFAEHFVTARDALEAAIARVKQQHADQVAHEAEQRQIKADRDRLEQLEREAAERRIADEQRAAAERAEADRLAQIERDRIAAEERLRLAAEQREYAEQERIKREVQAEADRVRREEEARARAEQEAALQDERERQAEAQRNLDEQAEQLRKEKAAAAKKAEAERLANLGLREAANAVVNYFQSDEFREISDRTGYLVPKCVFDLDAVLDKDADQAKPARGKKAAA